MMAKPNGLSNDVLTRALDLENLAAAWDEVRQNRGGPGGDLITLTRFARRLELNLLQLAERVQTGVYQPGRVRMVTIQTGQKRREIAIWCVADRVLQRALLRVLEPLFEPVFLPMSFGYRPGRSVQDAVRRLLRLRDDGYHWVLDADIRDCFLNLDHHLLLSFLRQRIGDDDLLNLIARWLPYGRPRRLSRSQQPRGISLGGVISPLLCNVYLHRLDAALRRQRLQAIRYADDFVVLCPTAEQRDHAMAVVQTVLETIRLEVNPQKTHLTSFREGFTFLGVHFQGNKYTYQWHGKSVEADDLGDVFPLDIDGYR